MDIITQFLNGVRTTAAGADPRFIAFLIKLALLLVAPVALCFLSFQQGHATKGLQICWCVVGVLAVGFIPTEVLTVDNPTVRVWLIILSALAIWFLPRVLAFLLEPTLGPQRRLAGRIYFVVGTLVVLAAFLKGGR